MRIRLPRPGRSRYDREIRRLAIPALGSLTVEPVYVLVDTAIVGHIGTPELGGVAVAGVVLTSMFAIFNFLAYSTTAAVARRFGAGRERDAAEAGVAALWLGIGLGLALMIASLAASSLIVDAMGASGTVRPHALTYLRISALGLPAVMIMLAATGYLRGLQDTARPFVVLLASNTVNLVLEVWFVIGLGWGVAGSAWSTIIAQYGAAAIFVVVLVRRAATARASMRPIPHEVRAAATLGATFSVRTAALLAALLAATGVAARIGDAEVAAYQITFQLWLLLVLCLDALAIAGQAMTGRFLGAGAAEEARAAGRRMLEWGLLIGVLLTVVLLVVRVPVVALFTPDTEVRTLATQALIVVALLQPIGSVAFVLDGVLIGAGEARWLAVVVTFSTFVVYAPLLVIVLASSAPLWVLWLALGAWIASRALGNLVRFRGDRWQVTGSVRRI